MKFKIWKFAEISFGKDDAEIVIPFLLMLSLAYYKVYNPSVIIISGCLYYLTYFIFPKIKEPIKSIIRKINCMKCPKCRSKSIIYQGMGEYRGDVPYNYYLCMICGSTFIDAINVLIITHDPELNRSNPSKVNNEVNDDIPW
jgi:DNA-directed RNA polymerase subunit RPC12/RpoP